jgi:hypothetical protein
VGFASEKVERNSAHYYCVILIIVFVLLFGAVTRAFRLSRSSSLSRQHSIEKTKKTSVQNHEFCCCHLGF